MDSFNVKTVTMSNHGETLITDRTRYINQITSYLDQIFPEFKPLFPNGLNKSAFYLLTHYITPKKMSRINQIKYKKMKSELKNPISYQKICQIKEAAINSIGNSSKELEFALKSSLDIYLYIDSKIDELEINIKETYLSLNCRIHTIRGLGILTAAGIISEYGNLNRFLTRNQMLAYSGLEPSKNDSDQHFGSSKMVKHGSAYLRKYLMNAAETFYVHNPVISDFYWKKRNEGKHHRVALSHVARKLVNVIYTLEKNNINFVSSLLK